MMSYLKTSANATALFEKLLLFEKTRHKSPVFSKDDGASRQVHNMIDVFSKLFIGDQLTNSVTNPSKSEKKRENLTAPMKIVIAKKNRAPKKVQVRTTHSYFGVYKYCYTDL